MKKDFTEHAGFAEDTAAEEPDTTVQDNPMVQDDPINALAGDFQSEPVSNPGISAELSLLEEFPELARVEKRAPGSYREVKSFVLRGQRLKEGQIRAVREHLYDYAVFYREQALDFKALFGNSNPVVIEIGFGMGDGTACLAMENPDINYLGIEVFLYGFTKLLANCSKNGIKNLKLMRFDATEVLNDMIPDGSVSGFHIFFPDPWPKKRHHGRRLVQEPFARLLASKLRPGGYIYCVTDWEDYAGEILDILSGLDELKNPYGGYAPRRPWRPQTNFELKAVKEGRRIFEILAEKRESD